MDEICLPRLEKITSQGHECQQWLLTLEWQDSGRFPCVLQTSFVGNCTGAIRVLLCRRVIDAGTGSLQDVRPTDADIVKCRRRYEVFKVCPGGHMVALIT